jgi:hypothetical protein
MRTEHLDKHEASIRADERQRIVKEIDRLAKAAARLHSMTGALCEDIEAFLGEDYGDVISQPSRKRKPRYGAITPNPAQIEAVKTAVSDILCKVPGHAFKPSELVGATHLGKKTIAAVFRHLEFSEKNGRFTWSGQARVGLGSESQGGLGSGLE